MSRRLYEEQPLDRLLLMGRALERARPLAGGRMLAAVLTGDDFAAAGGDDTEGHRRGDARACAGVRAAALVREAGPDGQLPRVAAHGRPRRSTSRRSRAQEGGGGHRAAAGFSTRRPPEDLLAWLDAQMTERMDANGADG